MKVSWRTVLSSLAILFFSFSVSYASDYGWFTPKINDNNYIVWTEGGILNDGRIFLYNGSSVIKLSNDETLGHTVKINNKNHVVWMDDNMEIFFYNGSKVIQLTGDLSFGTYPDINDYDQIVFWGFTISSGWGVFVYNGSTVGPISTTYEDNFTDLWPVINNDGHIAWRREYDNDEEEDTDDILLYNGSTTLRLTSNDYDDGYPQINNNGHVIWTADRDDDGNDEIFYYDGSTPIKTLYSNNYDIERVLLNDNNLVVFECDDNTGHGLFSYDGSNFSKIISADSFGYFDINDHGDIVWMGNGPDDSGDYGIWVYDASSGNCKRISDGFENDIYTGSYMWPQINNNGHVIWMSKDASDNTLSGGTLYYYNGSTVTALVYDESSSTSEIPYVSLDDDPNTDIDTDVDVDIDDGLTGDIASAATGGMCFISTLF